MDPNQNTRGGGLENGILNKGVGRRKDSSIGKNGQVFLSKTLTPTNQTPKQKENEKGE